MKTFIVSSSRIQVLGSVLALSMASSVFGHNGEDHSGMDHSTMDHSKMEMPSEPAQKPAPKKPADPHAGHTMPAPSTEPGKDIKSKDTMDHAAMGHGEPKSSTQPREPIPELTPADRAAAFPEVGGHAAHDKHLQSFVLFNRLEGFDADAGNGLAWEGQAWVGGDMNRLWVRSEGERLDGATESSDLELLYGRSISRWWDLVAGARQLDVQSVQSADPQNFAAIGLIGLAPYFFEVEATLYLGDSQTAARLEAEYDLLLTNRLILQPLVELNLYGDTDEERRIGSGLSSAEAGLRLRYEFRRELAPYIGIRWEKAFGDTADFAWAEGGEVTDSEFVLGLRTWF